MMAEDSPFHILIVGLGLIGGSLAQSLRGFPNSAVYGVDLDEAVLRRAESEGVIQKGYVNAADICPQCDLVFVCLFPEQTVAFINAAQFKPGAVVTDVCGVKGSVIPHIRTDIDFIGGHPMAGKEHGGYANASEELFLGACYILTPTKQTSPQAIRLMRGIAGYIGCKQTVVLSPERHDQMAAFTSHLMHVVAAALCISPQFAEFSAYGAGSLRDCTRVADINPILWTELFLENKEALLASIQSFGDSMEQLKEAIRNEDGQQLLSLLSLSKANKQKHKQTDRAM